MRSSWRVRGSRLRWRRTSGLDIVYVEPPGAELSHQAHLRVVLPCSHFFPFEVSPTVCHQLCELYCMLAACACSIHSVRHESLIRDFEHAWHTSACADRSVVYAFFPPSIRPSRLQDVKVLCRCLLPEGMHFFCLPGNPLEKHLSSMQIGDRQSIVNVTRWKMMPVLCQCTQHVVQA